MATITKITKNGVEYDLGVVEKEGIITTVNASEELGQSIFAPTTGGTSGYSLKSNGAASAPTWGQDIITTVNGTSATKGRSVYVPTTGGTSGYKLKSNGTSSAPTWAQDLITSVNGSTTTGKAIYAPTTGLAAFDNYSKTRRQLLRCDGSNGVVWATPQKLYSADLSTTGNKTLISGQSFANHSILFFLARLGVSYYPIVYPYEEFWNTNTGKSVALDISSTAVTRYLEFYRVSDTVINIKVNIGLEGLTIWGI